MNVQGTGTDTVHWYSGGQVGRKGLSQGHVVKDNASHTVSG